PEKVCLTHPSVPLVTACNVVRRPCPGGQPGIAVQLGKLPDGRSPHKQRLSPDGNERRYENPQTVMHARISPRHPPTNGATTIITLQRVRETIHAQPFNKCSRLHATALARRLGSRAAQSGCGSTRGRFASLPRSNDTSHHGCIDTTGTQGAGRSTAGR